MAIRVVDMLKNMGMLRAMYRGLDDGSWLIMRLKGIYRGIVRVNGSRQCDSK